MHLHIPHFKPSERSALRGLLGALLAILLALFLIFLMAILLVYPNALWAAHLESPLGQTVQTAHG